MDSTGPHPEDAEKEQRVSCRHISGGIPTDVSVVDDDGQEVPRVKQETGEEPRKSATGMQMCEGRGQEMVNRENRNLGTWLP